MKVVVGLIILFLVLFCFALTKTAQGADRRYEEIKRRENLRKEIVADGN